MESPARRIATMDGSKSTGASVEIMRCSRCAMSVETIARGGMVSPDDASANGMVKFGHNLYYCDRCAKMVGYK